MRILCTGCLREVELPVEKIEKKVDCPYCGRPLDTSVNNPVIKRVIRSKGIPIENNESQRQQQSREPQPPVNQRSQQTGHKLQSNQHAQPSKPVQRKPVDYNINTSFSLNNEPKIPDLVEFECPHCTAVYKLPTSKIPKNREFRLTCKNCNQASIVSLEMLLDIKKPEKIELDENAINEVLGNTDAFPAPRPGQLKGRSKIIDSPEFDSVYNQPVDNYSTNNNYNDFANNSSYKAPTVNNTPSQTPGNFNEPEIAPTLAPTEDKKSRYFTKTNTEIFGPLSIEELERWAEQGLLHPDDLVAKSGALYQPARTMPELRNFFGTKSVNERHGKAIDFGIDEEEGWSLKKTIRGALAGSLGGLATAILMVIWSLVSCEMVRMSPFTENAELTFLMSTLVRLLMWSVMGTMLGILFSVVEGLFFQDANIWVYRNNWIGVSVGFVIGFFLMIFGGFGIFGIIGLCFTFLILTSMMIFVFRTFFAADDLVDV